MARKAHEAEYMQVGSQRIRMDRCPACTHTGHLPTPCETLTGSLDMGTGEHSPMTPCTCGHEGAPTLDRQRSTCATCGRRVEIARNVPTGWSHLPTVAGLEAEQDHPAIPAT